MSIKQWKDFTKYHENFLVVNPELKNHSVVLALQLQVELAMELVEDVKA